MDITGKIKKVMKEQQVTEKFKKREFVIETKDEYPQTILLQLAQAKCELINNFSVGDEVKAHINIRGKEYTNKEGKISYFNTIDCWKIELAGEKEEANGATPSSDLPF